MANTIGFGQAAVNNTIDYGQGAIDNTINWGKSQTLSPSGETNITGTGGTPPFSNTKSILTDGVDDFVSIPTITLATDFSLSMWVKLATIGTVRDQVFGGPSGFFLFSTTVLGGGPIANKMCYYTGSTYVALTPTLRDGNWHNIVITYNSSATNLIAYTDGVETYNATYDAGTNNVINRISEDTYGNHWKGNLDELAVWNSVINIGDVWDGSGVPFDISSTNPLSWWRCGDGDTAPTLLDNGSGGNDGTMTNFSTFSTDVPTASSFTNTKSILLDGVDDFVTMGNVLNMADDGTDSFSCSFWMKRNSFNTEMIVSKQLNSGSYNGFSIYIVQGRLYFFIGSGTSPNSQITGRSTNYVIGSNWNNVILTYDGSQDISGFNIYINGVSDSVVTISNNTPTKVSNTTDFQLSGRAGGTNLVYGGGLDEVAFWNGTELTSVQANEIGSILPTDLSTYNPTSWWRCGDGDTSPTLTDNGSGGNNGTMTNFTTFSTDVPT